MSEPWSKQKEIEFFQSCRTFASPEQLFYLSNDNRYYAYWPKSYDGVKSTLQSRNSLIGNFTEKFSVDLLQDIARSLGYYAVQGVVCEEIALSSQSSADVAFCISKKNSQKSCDIVALFEVKMSIVWNWELLNYGKDEKIVCLGDYTTHRGNPGLLRSDTMLKAIGKSINIRVSSYQGSHIPIIILGNTPITDSYVSKVDYLKKAGIIQGFWSVNPTPLDNSDSLKCSPQNGFIRIDSMAELENNLKKLLTEPREFFSSMKSKQELGKIIEIANQENELEKKAQKFLSLLRD